MSQKIGYQCKAFYNAGTYASPTWTEITKGRDATLNITADEADVSERAGGGWKAYLAALFDGNLSVEVNWDFSNAVLRKLKQTFLRRDTIEIYAANGAVQADCEGFRATCVIPTFTHKQPLSDGVKVDLTFKPTPADNAPYWMVVRQIDTAESTTGSGANLYLDAVTGYATFVEGSNEYLGATVHDYVTGAAVVYYDPGTAESAGS